MGDETVRKHIWIDRRIAAVAVDLDSVAWMVGCWQEDGVLLRFWETERVMRDSCR